MNAKSIPLVALLPALLAAAASAQDPAVVGPDIYDCKFENAHARVCEVTFQPGAAIPSHSHPQHLIYVLRPGKLRITAKGTEGSDADFQAGQVVWVPAETHEAVNTGAVEVKALVIEFKDLKE